MEEDKRYIMFKVVSIPTGFREQDAPASNNCDEILVMQSIGEAGKRQTTISSCVGRENRQMSQEELWNQWLVLANVLREAPLLSPEHRRLCEAVSNVTSGYIPRESRVLMH